MRLTWRMGGRKRREKIHPLLHTSWAFAPSLCLLYDHMLVHTHWYKINSQCIYFLSLFPFLSLHHCFLSLTLSLFLHKHTQLWSDWCKLAWVWRWSGCDYCLAFRQLWWWHSALWAPLAWAGSKHNQAVHTLLRNHPYIWPRHNYSSHSLLNVMYCTLDLFILCYLRQKCSKLKA